MSDEEEDGINVTIKEGIKPNFTQSAPPTIASVAVKPSAETNSASPNVSGGKPMEASKVVIPDNTKRDRKNHTPTSAKEANHETKKERRNGSAKRKTANKGRSDASKGSLAEMLSRQSAPQARSTPSSTNAKRIRSPETETSDINLKQPTKMSKGPDPKPQPPHTVEHTPTSTNDGSYSEVAKRTLLFKVCLAGCLYWERPEERQRLLK